MVAAVHAKTGQGRLHEALHGAKRKEDGWGTVLHSQSHALVTTGSFSVCFDGRGEDCCFGVAGALQARTLRGPHFERAHVHAWSLVRSGAGGTSGGRGGNHKLTREAILSALSRYCWWHRTLPVAQTMPNCSYTRARSFSHVSCKGGGGIQVGGWPRTLGISAQPSS